MKLIRPSAVADSGSFTRATVGTYYDSTGTLQTASANTPRFNYDPTNLPSGPSLLIEAAATNLLLNSATLATQSVTVAAGSYTFAFTGTGTVVLSGAATATLVGGTNRSKVTVVATAGSLTLTPSGACTLAQLETGAIATSYIATTSASVTRAADVNSLSLVSNIPENDYAVWVSGTTYAVGNRVLVLATHKIYECSTAHTASGANTPPNTAFWLDAGSDNRWKMFDQSITSQTTAAGTIIVAVTGMNRIDSIVGLNISAASATINVNDPTSGLVYSKQILLAANSGIVDWYAYFYEPIISITDFIVTDLPAAYIGATITVAITSTGTAAIGGLVMGLSKEVGVTEAGAKVGIVSYSVKTRTAFGDYIVTPRNFSKRADFTIQIDTSTVDALQSMLAGYRDIPIVYVGSNFAAPGQYTSTIIYGFYKDFDITISYPPLSVCNIQIEGLT